MGRGGAHIGRTNDESSGKLSLDGEVIRLDVAAMKESGKRATADDDAGGHRRGAGGEVGDRYLRNPGRERAKRDVTAGPGETLRNGERIRIVEYTRHG